MELKQNEIVNEIETNSQLIFIPGESKRARYLHWISNSDFKPE